jgi:hypothetical protein
MDVLTGPVLERHADPAIEKITSAATAAPAGAQEARRGKAAAAGHDGLPGLKCWNPSNIAKTPDSA